MFSFNPQPACFWVIVMACGGRRVTILSGAYLFFFFLNHKFALSLKLVVGIFSQLANSPVSLAKIPTQVMKSQLEFCKLTRNQIQYHLLNKSDKIVT